MQTITKLLVANRSEIAIRVCRAATELGIRTVAIYAQEDRFALHRFKADEAYLVGRGLDPIGAYLSIDDIIRVALKAGVDAIHPGYGFLSESPEFAQACEDNGILFVGPSVETLRRLGDKVAARALAEQARVPLVPATKALPHEREEILSLARNIGFPLMVKASWGGGGRGMRMVFEEEKLLTEVETARREAEAAFGKDEVYLEKLVERARHIEVQIIGDTASQRVHLFERDCTVQRRHQKVVEIAPASSLPEAQRRAMHEAALRLAAAAEYKNAGTVEFLYDLDAEAFYFIEVNPRIQVEHTVTEEVTQIDIVKAQIRIAAGGRIGLGLAQGGCGIPVQADIHAQGVAIQCRITSEDPEHNFLPSYGRIEAYRGAMGFGVRLDGGNAFSGAVVTPHFDSLLEKLTVHATTRGEAVERLNRALREFRIRGVQTNLAFLIGLIEHPDFLADQVTTRFIDLTPALFDFPVRRDRASKLLRFLATTLVNGNPEVEQRPAVARQPLTALPRLDEDGLQGTRQRLQSLGRDAFLDWLRAEKAVCLTDTTFRDAHQSLLATRMRTADLAAPLPAYEAGMKRLFSLEVWGGATFDVAMRFLKEDPWQRLALMRQACPSILFQMLLRGANAVGYTSYPDNVVRDFIAQAARGPDGAGGIDLFRVFDSLNWVENMRVAMDAVIEQGALCEATICYTGDIFDAARPKYDLKYYVGLAKSLEAAGAHLIAIKDMAGVCRPRAARALIKALKEEVSLPLHFHMHDTSGGGMATLLAAAEAGADVIDAAIDSLSGLTSQPSLGSLVAQLEGGERDTGIAAASLRHLNAYWEAVRRHYAAFESEMRAGSSDVYLHEMPGGQYTNLREQARALGLEKKWPQVVETYASVNQLFGDIIKVTPSSKVVGDMALFMVSNNLSDAALLDPEQPISFPDSVISFFKGELGQPVGGFPKALQAKVLRGEAPLETRPGLNLPPEDLEAVRAHIAEQMGQPLSYISDTMRAAYLMYPKVFLDFRNHIREYGDTSVLPTPIFFYGPEVGEEFAVEIAQGKTLIIRTLAVSEPDAKGRRTVFFELNGQPRNITIADRHAVTKEPIQPQVSGKPGEVGAAMPGTVTALFVKPGDTVAAGDALLSLEAMKMETTIFAEQSGTVEALHIAQGVQVEPKDLLMEIMPAS
jgi:pyruvate carboxylase